MVQVNFALREVNCKIVYYGPGRSGKTTNLEKVHEKAPKDSIGELISIATETDRTLYFDFLPLNLGSVGGMATKFQLYTVPGQVYYNATRKLVLQGADGVVFVADSQKSMREENIESLQNLADNMAELGMDIGKTPLVLQWNKRDLADILTPEEMNADMNKWGVPTYEAVAVTGDGVFPTLKGIATEVIKKLNAERASGPGRPSLGGAPRPAMGPSQPKPEPKPEPAPEPKPEPKPEPAPTAQAPQPEPVAKKPEPPAPKPEPAPPADEPKPQTEGQYPPAMDTSSLYQNAGIKYTAKAPVETFETPAPAPKGHRSREKDEREPVLAHAEKGAEEHHASAQEAGETPQQTANPFLRELAKRKTHDETEHKPSSTPAASTAKKKWWQFWK